MLYTIVLCQSTVVVLTVCCFMCFLEWLRANFKNSIGFCFTTNLDCIIMFCFLSLPFLWGTYVNFCPLKKGCHGSILFCLTMWYPVITPQEGPHRVSALHSWTFQLLEPSNKFKKSWGCAQWWSPWLACMRLGFCQWW